MPDEFSAVGEYLKAVRGLASGRYLLYKAAILEHAPVFEKLPASCWQAVATLREVAWGTRPLDAMHFLRQRLCPSLRDRGYFWALLDCCLSFGDQHVIAAAFYAARVAGVSEQDPLAASWDGLVASVRERAWQLGAAFCVLRNPLWLTPVQEQWNGGLLADLALECVVNREAYPILGDALEEVGAPRAAIDHCKAETHCHGCWVLDGLIKKPAPAVRSAPASEDGV